MNIVYEYVSLELENKIIAYRRDFHRYPELGWTEYRTTAKIAERLKELGYEVYLGKSVCDATSRMGVPKRESLKKCEERAREEGVPGEILEVMQDGFTGVVGVIKGLNGTRKTAVRFDIDALSIGETSTESNVVYKSLHDNVMHACGHDGHAAVGLGLAEILAVHREEIEGEIRLIFQPAEEGCRGAKAIVNKGWLDDVDIFLSGHIGIGCRQLGQIGACTRGFMASTKLNIYFHGQAAHAANAPEKGKNALLAAADFTVGAYDFYKNSPKDTRMNVGRLVSGSGRNIIADEAYLEIETRGETAESNQYMKENICEIIMQTAKAHRVDYEIDVVGDVDTGKSDQTLIDCGYETAVSMGLGDKYRANGEFTASEDVIHMMNAVQEHGGQAAYFMFGTELAAEHHHPCFDFDEQVLPLMVEFYAKVLVKKHK